MHRRTVAALLLAAPLGACAPVFEKALTPSGDPCPDIPIYGVGQTVDRAYHRKGPIASSLQASTDPERLESLRREACRVGADAVIEAGNEDAKLPDGTGYVTRATGTAVIWRRMPGGFRPIQSLQKAPPPAAEAAPAPSTVPTSGNAPEAERPKTPINSH